MKSTLKIIMLVFCTFGYFTMLNAQIYDNISMKEKDLFFQKNGDYDEFINKEHLCTEEIGKPKLPLFIETYVVPYESTVTGVEIISITKKKAKGEYYILPTQPPIPVDWSEAPTFVEPDTSIYESLLPYPGKYLEMVSDGYMHGYHVITIKMYPTEYIPKAKELYLLDIKFKINYSHEKRSNKIIPDKQSLKRAEMAKVFIRGHVKNVDDVEGFMNKQTRIVAGNGNIVTKTKDTVKPAMLKSTNVIEKQVPDYIIITNEELKPTFQILADWKTKKGVPALIKTIEEIETNYSGCDLQEKIRNYLKDAYALWGADLFILIGGDVNIVPARMVNRVQSSKTGQKPTDLYYATIEGTWNANYNNLFGELYVDGVDYEQDLIVGRASVNDIAEAEVFVNKITSVRLFKADFQLFII